MTDRNNHKTLKQYCIENNRPELLFQWNYEKNGDLNPSNVLAGSGRKVWWVDKLGHAWQQSVYNRCYRNCGCPICLGRVVLPGYNDLVTKNPVLAKQWNYTKNGQLKPQDVSANSTRKVWWKCEKGHEW